MTRGRKTKLTPARQSDIIQALEAGNYFDASCEYAGITSRTGYHWLERGEKETKRREKSNVKEGSKQWEKEEPFLQFFRAVTRASARVEVATIAEIKRAGIGSKDNPGDWRALSWFMEHRYPTKWGKQYSESKNENDHTFRLVYPDDDS